MSPNGVQSIVAKPCISATVAISVFFFRQPVESESDYFSNQLLPYTIYANTNSAIKENYV